MFITIKLQEKTHYLQVDVFPNYSVIFKILGLDLRIQAAESLKSLDGS